MADRAADLQAELAGLLSQHEPTLRDDERADLSQIEQRCSWRPGSRPTRPEPMVVAFLNLFDRAEQEEFTDRTLAAGTVDDLRRTFREQLSRETPLS